MSYIYFDGRLPMCLAIKTKTDVKEIEIIGLHPIHTSGAVPAEAQFKVVFDYREAGQVKDPERSKNENN